MTRKKRRHGEPEYSKHHAMPKSREGANEPPNKEKIRHDVHRAIHMLFQNQHTLEKLDTLITLDDAILQDHFKRIIMDIVSMSPQDVFRIEAFRSKHGYKSIKTNLDG